MFCVLGPSRNEMMKRLSEIQKENKVSVIFLQLCLSFILLFLCRVSFIIIVLHRTVKAICFTSTLSISFLDQ